MLPLPLKMVSAVFFVCSLGFAVHTHQRWMLACHASEYTAGDSGRIGGAEFGLLGAIVSAKVL